MDSIGGSYLVCLIDDEKKAGIDRSGKRKKEKKKKLTNLYLREVITQPDRSKIFLCDRIVRHPILILILVLRVTVALGLSSYIHTHIYNREWNVTARQLCQ